MPDHGDHAPDSAAQPHDAPRPPRTSSPDDERDRRRHDASNRWETFAHVATVLVAVAAIGLSVWQGYENRHFYRLSVLPNLEPREATWGTPAPVAPEYFLLPEGADSMFAVGYSLKNSGLGPAVLRNLLVYRDAELVFDASRSDGPYLLADVKADLDRLPFPTLDLNQGYSAGDMLEAGAVHHLITVGVSFAAVDEDAFARDVPDIITEDVLETYSFVFCYCSVYDTDCGMTHLGSAPPVENVCRF